MWLLYFVLLAVVGSCFVLIVIDTASRRTIMFNELPARSRYAMATAFICFAITALAQAVDRGNVAFNLLGVGLCLALAFIIVRDRPPSPP